LKYFAIIAVILAMLTVSLSACAPVTQSADVAAEETAEQETASSSFPLYELEHMINAYIIGVHRPDMVFTVVVLDTEGNLVAGYSDISASVPDSVPSLSFLEMARTMLLFTDDSGFTLPTDGQASVREVLYHATSALFEAIEEEVPQRAAGFYAFEEDVHASFVGFAPFDAPEYIILLDARVGEDGSSLTEDDGLFLLHLLMYRLLNLIIGSQVEDAFFVKLYGIDELLEVTDGFLLISRPTCPGCVEFAPVLFDVSTATETPVYYFNTDNWRSDERFGETLASFEVRTVPTLLEMRNGEAHVIFSGSEDDWEAAFHP